MKVRNTHAGVGMQVFISWSGDRSKAVAQALEVWIRRLIQAVEPWISAEIGKGSRWNREIASRRELSKLGIVCLTADNLLSPWLHFEAGTISKSADALVCTVLLDVAPSDVEPPLGDFQHTAVTEEDMRRLVRDINTAVARVGERAVPVDDLDDLFAQSWPRLSDRLQEVKSQPIPGKKTKRGEREILDEILDIVRRQERRIGDSPSLTVITDKVGSGKSPPRYVILTKSGFKTVMAPPGSKIVRRTKSDGTFRHVVKTLDGSARWSRSRTRMIPKRSTRRRGRRTAFAFSHTVKRPAPIFRGP
jgi:hypothetical protein